jgi:amidohydrolase
MPIDPGSLEEARATALAAIDSAATDLRGLSLDIHEHPELAYEETHAHAAVADFLEQRRFSVERSAYGVDTAFRAVAGSGGPTIAVLCEYDALPGIGHACGHNLIATAGVATGLALEAALGEGNGTVVVLGTPAEERGGGKIDLIDAGAFADVDAAMMLHPSGGIGAGKVRTRGRPNAIQSVFVTYQGRNAHAAGRPWDGLNALDALIHAFNGISLLRQQMRPTARVHGIITDGGKAPNIIPDETGAHFYVREISMPRLDELRPRVQACFEAAAMATGTELEARWQGHVYSDMLSSSPLAESYEEHAATLGMDVDPEPRLGGGSTDMGNVTYVVPGIHPSFGIEADAANHTAGFTDAAATESAHAETLRAAKALALTALDLYSDEAKIAAAKAELADRLEDPHEDDD